MRILVIEDNKILAESIKSGLTEENYAVDAVNDGRLGYEQAAVEDYDAVVLDIMLPGMDGTEICRNLRREKNNVPILMLTARDTIEDKISGLNLGADDYLVKPFSFEELVARLRALIRRSNKSGTILTVDNLELDPAAHTVKRSGKEVKLTGKEYTLLEYFMINSGRILTREQIVTHVWDYAYDAESNTIDVLVARLRTKIDRAHPQEKPLFSTVRGLGYKLGV